MNSVLSRIAPYLQVAPLTLVLLIFFGIPLALVVAVSFSRSAWATAGAEKSTFFASANPFEVFPSTA